MGTRVEADAGGGLRVVVEGELDLLTAPELERAVTRVGRSGERIELDLAGVEFVDSSGFRVLMRAAEATPQLAVTAASAVVRRYAHLTGARLPAA